LYTRQFAETALIPLLRGGDGLGCGDKPPGLSR
jgi:hypothetical protein